MGSHRELRVIGIVPDQWLIVLSGSDLKQTKREEQRRQEEEKRSREDEERKRTERRESEKRRQEREGSAQQRLEEHISSFTKRFFAVVQA